MDRWFVCSLAVLLVVLALVVGWISGQASIAKACAPVGIFHVDGNSYICTPYRPGETT